MMKRIDQDALAPRPDLVIWQTGSNDPLRGVPLDRFKDETRDSRPEAEKRRNRRHVARAAMVRGVRPHADLDRPIATRSARSARNSTSRRSSVQA